MPKNNESFSRALNVNHQNMPKNKFMIITFMVINGKFEKQSFFLCNHAKNEVYLHIQSLESIDKNVIKSYEALVLIFINIIFIANIILYMYIYGRMHVRLVSMNIRFLCNMKNTKLPLLEEITWDFFAQGFSSCHCCVSFNSIMLFFSDNNI